MKTAYLPPKKFSPRVLSLLDATFEIMEEYRAAGFVLTLRQLYYQFVSRGLLPNSTNEYRKLANVVNDGRMVGLLDWDMIEDRTRDLVSIPHWTTPSHIINSAARSFTVDKWMGQPNRVEVWVEKDALLGILETVCTPLDVSYLSCRGYFSQSEMWEASKRFIEYNEEEQHVVVIHLGDHDPSGIDMTRDIAERLTTFRVPSFEVRRVALNMSQVRRYNPPPNPAKVTDARFKRYLKEFGIESWELDALEPKTIASVIRDTIESLVDQKIFDKAVRSEKIYKRELDVAAERWDEVSAFLRL